jgi:hypothetical protein
VIPGAAGTAPSMDEDRKTPAETDPVEERARIREDLPSEGETATEQQDDPSARDAQPGAAGERYRDYD